MLDCSLSFIHSQNGSAGVYHGESRFLQGIGGLNVMELAEALSVPVSLYSDDHGSKKQYLGVVIHLMQSVTTDEIEEHDNFSIEGEASRILDLLLTIESNLKREGKDSYVASIDDFTSLLEEAKMVYRGTLKRIPKQIELNLN